MIKLNPHIDNLIFQGIFYGTLISESPHFNLSSFQIKRVIEAFNICNININKTDENLNYIYNTTRSSLFALFKIIPMLSFQSTHLLLKFISNLPPKFQSQNLVNAADLFTYSLNDPATSIALLPRIYELPNASKLFEQNNWHFLNIIEDLIVKFPNQKNNILNNIEKLYIWTDKIIQNAAKDKPKAMLSNYTYYQNEKLPTHPQTTVVETLAKCFQLRRDILISSLSKQIKNPKLNIDSRLNLVEKEFKKFLVIDSIAQKCFLLILAFYNLPFIPVQALDSSSDESSYDENEEYEDVESRSELDSADSNISSEDSASAELNEKPSSIATNQHNDFDIETFASVVKESILPFFIGVMKKKLQ
jgi:hypothetical protein